VICGPWWRPFLPFKCLSNGSDRLASIPFDRAWQACGKFNLHPSAAANCQEIAHPANITAHQEKWTRIKEIRVKRAVIDRIGLPAHQVLTNAVYLKARSLNGMGNMKVVQCRLMFWSCWNTRKFWYEVTLQKRCDILDRIFSRSKCSISVSMALASRTVYIYIYYNNKRSRSQSSIAGENMCQCPVRFSGRRRLVAAAVSSKWGAGTLNRYVGLFQRVPSQNPDWNRLDQDVAHLTHTSTLYISVYLCFVSLGLGYADTWLSLFSVTIWRDSQHHSPDFDPLGLHSVGFMVLKFLLLLSLAISALEVKRLC
jgi:hypothetical protein